ncbi:MAG: hypothetical protein KDA50_00930 [Rhodobacteraceae bacterium]|nr:hypothetical protein [Paracoccaceae bacterium]
MTEAPPPVPLDVAADEMGLLRLFALDTDTADGRALRTALVTQTGPAADLVARALGVASVDPWWVTLVAMKDLDDMGLTTYLADGHDVPRAQLAAAQPVLETARGSLLLVQSPAFGHRAVTLDPAPWLAPLVCFDAKRAPAPVAPMPRADVAPVTALPPRKATVPGSGKVFLRPSVMLALLLAAAGLVALLTLAGGR